MAEPVNEPKPAVDAPQVTIVDPNNVPVQYVDWFVTGGMGPSEGAINIVLAALDYSMPIDGKLPRAIIQSRLRMTLRTATNFQRLLTEILSGAAAPNPPIANKIN